MLVDARTIADASRVEADVCIIGAGPAALAVAHELDRPGARIVALAGREELLRGEVAGEPYPPLADVRRGGIGGTAALWDGELAPASFGARYAPLAPIDFEAREGVPGSGWPFRRNELDPFYARAHELCDAGPFDYDAADPQAPFTDSELENGIFRFGLASAFTHVQRDRVAASKAVRVLTGAAATRICTTGGDRVEEVEAASDPGRRFRVRARAFVLAAGGIENPRLLLLSHLGNRDLVGRCFMDHPTIRCRFVLARGTDADFGFFDTQTIGARLVLGRVDLSEEALRREQLLNGGFFFVPARDRDARAAAAIRSIRGAARGRRLPEQPVTRAAEIVRGVDSLAFAAHRKLAVALPPLRRTLRLWPRAQLLNTLGVGRISGWSQLPARPRVFDVYHVIEQPPDRERRVTLGDARDAHGLPVPRLHWFLGGVELDSATRAEEILKATLGRHGIGRLTTGRELAPTRDLAAAVHPSVHHHLGATRMHVDSQHGVVDADARVHGVENLFVAGGSVFPTSGFVNPTLTIVALALRLGAHVRDNALT